MKRNLLIFDMDGTIIDTDWMVVSAWRELFRRHKPLEKPSLHKLLTFSGPPLKVSIAKEFPNEDLNLIKKEYADLTDAMYLSDVPSYPGLKEALLSLKAKSVILTINTNKSKDKCGIALDGAGLSGLFDYIVSGDDVIKSKPDPEGVNLILKRFGVRKEKALYIGDSLFDLKTAKAAGVDFMSVMWRLLPFPESEETPYHLASYNDLVRFLENE